MHILIHIIKAYLSIQSAYLITVDIHQNHCTVSEENMPPIAQKNKAAQTLATLKNTKNAFILDR